MGDPFSSSRYSIEHAKRHIDQLEREIAAFVRSNPYARAVEPNADATEDTHKIKLIKPLPAPLPGIAFDAANNLRSALDQAGYAVAIAASTKGRNAKFPFGDNITEVQSRIRSQSNDVPKEIFDVMVARQPYEGGNDILWALNKLANTNKHEVIIPIAAVTNLGELMTGDINIVRMDLPQRWDTAKNEMVLFSVPHGETPKYNLQLQVLVVIGEVKGVGGQPALGVLRAMLGEVEGSLMAIEAEARRIGLIA